MARYIHPDVRQVFKNPEPGESIKVVLALQQGTSEEAIRRVEDYSGHVIHESSSAVLVAKLPETESQAFCDVSVIESASS